MENFKQLLRNIRCFVFDVDGVLASSSLLIQPDGEWLRNMNVKDGYALQLAVKKGYRIIVISGSQPEAVRNRLNKLGIHDVFISVENKLYVLKKFSDTHRLSSDEILAMGDDLPDCEVLKYCAIACCPADAVQEIKNLCLYISEFKGGEGCVRDVIEQTLRVQGKWE